MRYIIYGAGAVGGVVGGRLFQAGHEVILIGRGDHLQAIQRDGLRLLTAEEDLLLPVPAVAHPREIAFRPDDAVILTMKTQDTEGALIDLENAAGVDVAVVCCQNGVENERLAARRFANVYAMLVSLPATFIEPGIVCGEGMPVSGVLDCGRYPEGVDDTITRIAAGISASRLDARAEPRVMRLKYRKLSQNMGNAIQVVTGESWGSEGFRLIARGLRDEAEACFAAAGIDVASEEEYNAGVQSRARVAEVPGQKRVGSSTWQSLIRGATTIETDYLNGEVVLLGRLHGVPTPYNSLIRTVANRIAASGEKPGGHTPADVIAMVEKMAGRGAAVS